MTAEKPRLKVPAYNIDAWQNPVTGAGTPGIDAGLYMGFGYGGRLTQRTLSLLYESDWLVGKICDRPALDATRQWLKVDDEIAEEFKRLGVQQKFKEALTWSRLYGGTAIFCIIEDGREPSEPVDYTRVRAVSDIQVFDRYYIWPTKINLDPSTPAYGKPEMYQISGSGIEIHADRVIQIDGVSLTRDRRDENNGWGGSFIDRYWRAITDYAQGVRDVAGLMSDSSLGILSIPNLTTNTAKGQSASQKIQNRLNKLNLNKSNFRSIAIDSQEQYDYVHRSLSGISDLMIRLEIQVSAAVEMPQLVLFGYTPGGIGGKNDVQIDSYYDGIKSIQTDRLQPGIEKLIKMLTQGSGEGFEWNPLERVDETEIADNRLKNAQALAAIAPLAGLTEDETRKAANEYGGYGFEEVDDDIDDGLE